MTQTGSRVVKSAPRTAGRECAERCPCRGRRITGAADAAAQASGEAGDCQTAERWRRPRGRPPGQGSRPVRDLVGQLPPSLTCGALVLSVHHHDRVGEVKITFTAFACYGGVGGEKYPLGCFLAIFIFWQHQPTLCGSATFLTRRVRYSLRRKAQYFRIPGEAAEKGQDWLHVDTRRRQAPVTSTAEGLGHFPVHMFDASVWLKVRKMDSRGVLPGPWLVPSRVRFHTRCQGHRDTGPGPLLFCLQGQHLVVLGGGRGQGYACLGHACDPPTHPWPRSVAHVAP